MARHSNSGNAVVMILLAVGLFAALAYTFMRGSKEGQGNLSGQQARIIAQDYINYALNMQKAVEKLRSRGCSENQLNFRNAVDSTQTVGAPSDQSCNVFSSFGGPLAENADFLYANPFVSGDFAVSGIGTSAADLIYDTGFLNTYNLLTRRDICMAINNILGITNTSIGPPSDSMSGGTRFGGSFAASDPANNQAINVAAFAGKSSGCRLESGTVDANTAIFSFYTVLIAR